MDFLIWLENSGFSVAVRESEGLWGYAIVIILHGMGMGIVVGVSTVIGLRLLGFVPRIPLEPMKDFFPYIWLGFWINAASGTVLMMSHATEMFTNWVMYIKLTFVALAIVSIRLIQTQVFSNPHPKWSAPKAKMAAGALLFFWIVAITAGRLTAYYGKLVSSFDLIQRGLR